MAGGLEEEWSGGVTREGRSGALGDSLSQGPGLVESAGWPGEHCWTTGSTGSTKSTGKPKDAFRRKHMADTQKSEKVEVHERKAEFGNENIGRFLCSLQE